MGSHNGSIDTTHTPLSCHFTIPLSSFLSQYLNLDFGPVPLAGSEGGRNVDFKIHKLFHRSKGKILFQILNN